jgi:hypothetical protein
LCHELIEVAKSRLALALSGACHVIQAPDAPRCSIDLHQGS